VGGAPISLHAGSSKLGRHLHHSGYIAVVLRGGYVEAGEGGRIPATAGDAIIHGPFDAHQDAFGRNGAVVLNLPLPAGLPPGFGRLDDADAVARLAERDAREAAKLAAASFRQSRKRCTDWPDRLAQALCSGERIGLAEWAGTIGIAPASLSRGFVKAYGVTPKRYRLEQRTSRALRALPHWRGSLAELAAAMDFADQAHLTRAVTSIAGHAPSRLRA
jgi:AraC-like DNA-binding protein